MTTTSNPSPEMQQILERAFADAVRERDNPDVEKVERDRARLHRWVKRVSNTPSTAAS
ncbi:MULTISPECIES: hypothetical protein [Rhodococcus]|uniref:hypothetical protein n=1 Tax=Rhodococcus TaxID=1827 RepID=UPI00041B9A0B|nr:MULTISPECIES: hypothetical protein [Rhodococcus]MCZ9634635.1 hypothetical protein [Rhodococcus sp. BH5]SCC69167.1 hypothetical protein GA0061093_12740 [Rhodococcus qingshengii]SUH12293.1 Uncharacterised protein [Rhodococcus erythropolis]